MIQNIDRLREHGGRVVTILCTNRLAILDVAIRRRAAVIEEFTRPTAAERRQLFEMDLDGVDLKPSEIQELVRLTGDRDGDPPFTYSDIRSRLYPTALAKAFPKRALTFGDLRDVAGIIRATPVMEDK